MGEGLLEEVASLRHNGGWENCINIVDMESSEDSQTKMLETLSSNSGEGACPSVVWKWPLSFLEEGQSPCLPAGGQFTMMAPRKKASRKCLCL